MVSEQGGRTRSLAGQFWIDGVVAEVCAEICSLERACWSYSSLSGEFCLAMMLRFICSGK